MSASPEAAGGAPGGRGVEHVTLGHGAHDVVRAVWEARGAPPEPTGDGSFTHAAVLADASALDAVIARATAMGLGPAEVDAMRADPRVARQFDRWADFLADIPAEGDFRLQKYPQGPAYPPIEPNASWLRCLTTQVRARARGPL